MKSLILSLLLAFSLISVGNAQNEVYTNGVFYPFTIFPDTVKYVVQNVGVENKTNHLVLGKTYGFPTELVEIDSKDSKVELFFSNDTIIRIYSNTKFSIDVFSQVVTNLNAQPSPLCAKMDNLGVSIMGGILDIISNSSTNNPVTLQTPTSAFALSTGMYRFNVDPKFNQVTSYVVRGNLILYDNDTLKETVIPEGSGTLVFPVRSHITENSQFVDDYSSRKMVFDVKKVRAGYLEELFDVIKPLETVKESVGFFVVDKKIVGVRLKN